MKTATEKEVTAEPAVVYQTENDLPKNTRVELIALINQRLADAIDLQAQLKQAHWNAKGPHFIGLHELFDKSPKRWSPTWTRSPSAPCNWAASPRARCASRPPAQGLTSIRWIFQTGRLTSKQWRVLFPHSDARHG